MTDSKQETLRTRRVDSTDRRVLKTRAKLIDAYRRLIDSSAVDAITVTAVVDEAAVTRSAFYTHFATVGDLAASALTEFNEAVIASARATIREGGSKSETNRQVNLELIRVLVDHRNVYGRLLLTDPDFTASLTAGAAASCLATLRTREHLHADPEVTSRYVAGGLIEVLKWWLADDGGRTDDQLADALIAIAPPDFRD